MKRHEPAPRPAAPRPAPPAPDLRLVSRRLVLAGAGEAAADTHGEALGKLADWLGVAIEWRRPGMPDALRAAARRALPGGDPAQPARFVPGHWFSPLAFQDPRALRSLPAARWVAGYLHEIGTGPGAGLRGIDTLVMSPHPAACRPDEDCAAALPGVASVRAMIAAARAERRERVAVIVPARCRGAATRLLLAAEPAPARAGLDFTVLSAEEALARIAAGTRLWDAIIVLPELRGLVVTVLAGQHAIAGPWPMLWHGREGVLICGETAEGARTAAPLDATLLVQSLALALRQAGDGAAARRLHAGWARLRDRGVTTAGRGTDGPYCTTVGEAEMVALLCSDAPATSARALADWKALPAAPTGRDAPAPARLSLVAAR